MDRTDLARKGMERVQAFHALNSIPLPQIQLHNTRVSGRECGHYDRQFKTVEVWVPATAKLGLSGRAWSYPGYLVDRTAHGVIAHECGHHWHLTLKRNESGKIAREFMDAKRKEGPLSGYEPNSMEVVAEAFRVFVGNPALLKILFPIRYWLFHDYGLEPLPQVDWREPILASGRHIKTAENKIRRRTRTPTGA